MKVGDTMIITDDPFGFAGQMTTVVALATFPTRWPYLVRVPGAAVQVTPMHTVAMDTLWAAGRLATPAELASYQLDQESGL